MVTYTLARFPPNIQILGLDYGPVMTGGEPAEFVVGMTDSQGGLVVQAQENTLRLGTWPIVVWTSDRRYSAVAILTVT